MLSLVFIVPASKYVFSLSKSGYFNLDVCPPPRSDHPELDGFFDIEFDRPWNPIANIVNIRRFSNFYTFDFTANTSNKKINNINHCLLTKEKVKLHQLSNPFHVGFWSFLYGVGNLTCTLIQINRHVAKGFLACEMWSHTRSILYTILFSL